MMNIYAVAKKFSFRGKTGGYFELQLANWVLTVITLGVYYPWAKASALRYLYHKTEFAGSRFRFHGTGKELLKGYLKAGAIFLLLSVALLVGLFADSEGLRVASLLFYGVSLIGLVPVALHGSLRYRASRSSWRGIYFGYRGKLKKLFRVFVLHLFLTIITAGIYGAWFTVRMRQEIIGNLRLGNVRFSYEGEGGAYLKILLKGYLLTLLTAGGYLFVFARELHQYFVNNIYVEQNGAYARLNSTVSGWGLFKLFAVNFLIVVFSLGIAQPVAVVRTLRYLAAHSELVGIFNANTLEQTEEPYSDATYEDVTDIMNLNLF